jgi:hypothetical protein
MTTIDDHAPPAGDEDNRAAVDATYMRRYVPPADAGEPNLSFFEDDVDVYTANYLVDVMHQQGPDSREYTLALNELKYRAECLDRIQRIMDADFDPDSAQVAIEIVRRGYCFDRIRQLIVNELNQ